MTFRTPVPDALQQELRAALPGADVAVAVFLDEGISSRAHRVRAGESSWIVRVPNDYPQPWRWGGGRAFEVPWLRHLASLGLPVPRDALSLDDPASGLPRVLITREIGGRPMAGPPPDTGPIVGELASFLRTVHAVPPSTARRLGLPERSQLDALAQAFQRVAPILPRGDADRVCEMLGRLEALEPAPVAVHGDFRGDHWFVDDACHLIGVIDFGDSALSDPAIDFARFTYQFGSSFRDELIRAYGAGDESLRERAILYEALEPLIELDGADEVEWWDRSEALAALRRGIDVS